MVSEIVSRLPVQAELLICDEIVGDYTWSVKGKAFDARLSWNAEAGSVSIKVGPIVDISALETAEAHATMHSLLEENARISVGRYTGAPLVYFEASVPLTGSSTDDVRTITRLLSHAHRQPLALLGIDAQLSGGPEQ